MTSKRTQLPLIPGLNSSPQKRDVRRKQQLGFANGLPILNDVQPPTRKVKHQNQTTSGESAQPAWLVYDKQTLCFNAYFKEAVHESPTEHFRVRQVKIFVFPEDDTVEIVEQRQPNSGILQGKLLRRHRVPKPEPYDDEHYEAEDFNIGVEVTIYGRTYRIVDCDEFTSKFLEERGIEVGVPEEMPSDMHTELRQTQKDAEIPLRPYERIDSLGKFLKYDGKVLRFYCLWDDSSNEAGDRRYLILLYFLADDTMELVEVHQPNSGRTGPATFLKRRKVPKVGRNLVSQPGGVTSRTLLNVFASDGLSGRHIPDNLITGDGLGDTYTEADLEIGREIDVFGRRILICDCDEFTKSYYRDNYGIEDFTPITVDEEEKAAPRMATPPPNGFGSDQDSLVSVRSLVPKAPKRDFKRWFEYGEQKLLFKAILETDNDVDSERRFAITFHLADSGLSVFEERTRNSGIPGGKFLEKGLVRHPSEKRYYDVGDMFIGSILKLSGREFRLVDASGFTLKFLMDEKLPMSNIDEIVSKLVSVIAPDDLFATLQIVSTDDGRVSADDFDRVMEEKVPQLHAHEARILGFACTSESSPDFVDVSKLNDIVATNLNSGQHGAQEME